MAQLTAAAGTKSSLFADGVLRQDKVLRFAPLCTALHRFAEDFVLAVKCKQKSCLLKELS
jgi:hypothetical protein